MQSLSDGKYISTNIGACLGDNNQGQVASWWYLGCPFNIALARCASLVCNFDPFGFLRFLAFLNLSLLFFPPAYLIVVLLVLFVRGLDHSLFINYFELGWYCCFICPNTQNLYLTRLCVPVYRVYAECQTV